MIQWILLGASALILLLIFWRRYLLTLKSTQFEEDLRKEEAADLRMQGEEEDLMAAEHELPSDLQLKRQAEQRERDEKTRKLREAKKAFKTADVHFTKGDYGLAEKYLLQVLSYDNDHLDANLKLGLLYLHQENLPRAEFFFQKLIDLKESPIYFSNMALTLYQQNRFEEAAKLYERAIDMDGKKPSRFVNLAYVYQELGELEKALLNFEQASRLDPRNLDYLWILLEFYEKFSRGDEMIRVLTKILELDPYNNEVKGKLKLLEETYGEQPVATNDEDAMPEPETEGAPGEENQPPR